MKPLKHCLSAILAVVALAFLFSTMMPAASANPPRDQRRKVDSVLGDRIAKGIVFEDKLWLRGSDVRGKGGSGGLIGLSLTDESRIVYFENGVVDITKIGTKLWLLRQMSVDGKEFVISVLKNGAFEDVARFALDKNEQPIDLVDDSTGPAVLSTEALRIFSESGLKWRVVKLRLNSTWNGVWGVQISVASPQNGDFLYIGSNRGEWGGGFQRIDTTTGVVTSVERRDTKDLCAGPLNGECDPVTGVIPDPQNKDCVLGSIGLTHMFHSTGRILRVCGDRVTVLFEKLIAGENDNTWPNTEAFFGLVSSQDGGFWGVTARAVYHFRSDGTQNQEYKLPMLKSFSGVYLSREVTGVIIIRTDVNWAVSTSGYTPLVVPLEEPQSRRDPLAK